MTTQNLKSRLWLRFTSIAMAAALSLSTVPTQSHAGLKDALNSMFVSTSTDAQAINTQRLRGIYGGSMNLRPAGHGINVIQFAKPSIDAGCGGIDIFFGSFSFINGAQFEQLIRSIAANAVGFAIKAAINQMCSPCGAILEELEKAIAKLNALAKNTCAIANKMFTPGGMKEIVETASGIGKNLSTAFQYASDWAASVNKENTEKPTVTAQGGSPTVGELNPYTGNIVHRAAFETLTRGTNTLSAYLSTKQVIEIIMGLYGTQINNPEEKLGDQCLTGSTDEKCIKMPEQYKPVITTWDHLFNPEKYNLTGMKVLRCLSASNGCKTVGTDVISLSEWGGSQYIINMALFGTSNPDDVANYSADSIVGAITKKTGFGGLSVNAKTLVKMAPLPILIAMLEVQYIPGGAETLGKQLATMLPEFLSYQIGAEFLTIGENIFSAQTTVDMPPAYSEALLSKKKELSSHRPDGAKLAEVMEMTNKSIRTLQMLSGSQLRAGGGAQ